MPVDHFTREQLSAQARKANLVKWGTRRKRCPCGVMTLKRAKARGHESKHKSGCPFHKPAGDKSRKRVTL